MELLNIEAWRFSHMSFWLKLDRFVGKTVMLIAGVFLMVMTGAVVANVAGRGFFDAPIYGTVEIVSLSGLFVISFAIGYTERKRSHIVIKILVSRLPQRIQALLAAITLFFSICILAVAAWGGFWIGVEDAITPGATTYVLHLNKAPFRFAWVLGCVVLLGFLVQHFIEELKKVRKK